MAAAKRSATPIDLNDPAKKRVPVTLRKMGHSREEFAFVGYLLHALGHAVDCERILEAVREGHRRERWDAAVPLAEGWCLLADWDGGLWHNAKRLEHDIQKTKTAIAWSRTVVVRVRVTTAVEFPELAGAIVVRSAWGHPAKAVESLAPELQRCLSLTDAEGLRQRATGARVKGVEEAVDTAWGTVDDTHFQRCKELEAFVGSEDLAKRLAATLGVTSRPQAVREMATWLCNHVGMNMRDVVRMCNCFWAQCDNPEPLMGFVQDLLNKGLEVKRIATIGGCFWSGSINHSNKLVVAIADLQARGLDINRIVVMGDGFWSAAIKHPGLLATTVADLQAKGLDTNGIVALGNCFWSAAINHPVAMADTIADLQANGLDVHQIASMRDGFWSAVVKAPTAITSIVRELRGREVSMNRIAMMGSCFWSAAVKQPIALAAAVAGLEAKGLNMKQVVAMSDCFWSAAVKHPVELAASVVNLQNKGLNIEQLAGMRGCFWSATIKHNAGVATSLALLDALGVSRGSWCKFENSFWAALAFHKEVLTLLTEDFGMQASELHLLRSFWATLKAQEDVDALRAELAALRTSGAVTRRLRFKNNGAPIGHGARWCAHARPKMVATPVVVPKATTQSSLTTFFKKA